MTDDIDWKKFNEEISKSLGESRERWSKETKMVEFIKEQVDKGIIPCFIYKQYKTRLSYRPLVDTISHLWKNKNKPYQFAVASTVFPFDGKYLRRLDYPNLKRIREIEKKKHELELEKQEILQKAWKENKKLSLQFAQEWDEVRNELLKKFGLRE